MFGLLGYGVLYFVLTKLFRRRSEPSIASQRLLDSGKGLELFQKRQERMAHFTVDEPNVNYKRERNLSAKPLKYPYWQE